MNQAFTEQGSSAHFDSIADALEELRRGKFIIVVDDEDRENEGDLVCAAEFCTDAMINFMARYACGLVCVALTEERAKQLDLGLMVEDNSALHGTRFTISVDSIRGTTSGISAADRANTVRALSNEATLPADLARPGHIFPLVSMNGGVLKRAGHTEAVVDMMRIAGLKPIGALCEILREDGTMARLLDLLPFAALHGLKVVSVQDLIAYRRKSEKLVNLVAEARLPTDYGEFNIKVYDNIVDGHENVAIIKGEIQSDSPVLVRVHSECLTGDIFGSRRCDCGDQLRTALQMIESEGCGVVLYMRQEGRGIGLVNKIKSYALQEEGFDTVDANIMLGFQPDPRDYGIGAQILFDLGVRKMRLMTNNPKKRVGLTSYGLEIVDLVALEVTSNTENIRYLETKRDKLGHILRHL